MPSGDKARLFGILLAVAAAIVSVAPEARAEHAARLILGPELRARPRDGAAQEPRYEVSVPHGLVSATGTTAFVFRLGMVLPNANASLAFPITVGLRYAPFETRVRPLLGGDMGGYLVAARGPRQNDSPNGPEMCWTVRALAGVSVHIFPSTALVVYADAAWAQMPRDERSRDYVFSGVGAGVELRVTFSYRSRLADMILLGTSSPQGL
ncbi:MAG: hypothetical protein ABUS79_01420 [Pseudomonadota bacterium]